MLLCDDVYSYSRGAINLYGDGQRRVLGFGKFGESFSPRCVFVCLFLCGESVVGVYCYWFAMGWVACCFVELPVFRDFGISR